MPPLTAAVSAMLDDMKRRANARHVADTARLMASAPSPPPSPRAFRSDARAVRNAMARAPSPPPRSATPPGPCARAAEHRRMLSRRMQQDRQQYADLVQRMRRTTQLLATLQQRCR